MLRASLRRLSAAKAPAKKVKVGDSVPEATVFAGNPPTPVDTAELLGGKTIVLLTVPGAFTGTCSKQVPMLAAKSAEIKAKFNAETLYCVATNDAFVMDAWAKSLGVEADQMKMLSDPSQSLLKALGLSVNLPVLGGARYSRACCVIADGKIVHLWEEPDAKKMTCTLPEEMLKEA